jgi:hypothetical protein
MDAYVNNWFTGAGDIHKHMQDVCKHGAFASNCEDGPVVHQLGRGPQGISVGFSRNSVSCRSQVSSEAECGISGGVEGQEEYNNKNTTM